MVLNHLKNGHVVKHSLTRLSNPSLVMIGCPILSKELDVPCGKLQSPGWNIWPTNDEGEATWQHGQW